MKKTAALGTAALLILSACSSPPSFSIKETDFELVDDALAWDDLPEVMEEMRKVEGIPEGLFATTVSIYPSWYWITEDDDSSRAFYDCDTGEIHMRNLTDYAYQSALAHEFAHRWNHLTGEGVDCSTEDSEEVHSSQAFIEKRQKLEYAACRGGWPVKDRNCQMLRPATQH